MRAVPESSLREELSSLNSLTFSIREILRDDVLMSERRYRIESSSSSLVRVALVGLSLERSEEGFKLARVERGCFSLIGEAVLHFIGELRSKEPEARLLRLFDPVL